MPYATFQKYFPEIAQSETRSITVPERHTVPADSYGLIEMYCDEPGCDCRRVFLMVASKERGRIEAVIAFGWESEDFYARWWGGNDPEMVAELKGPVLNLASPQTELAPALLKMVDCLVLQDPQYVARLKRHYRMFREVIERQGGAAWNSQCESPPPQNRSERRRMGQRGGRSKGRW